MFKRYFWIYRILLIFFLIFILLYQILLNYKFQNKISLEINSTESYSIFQSRFNQRLFSLGQRYSYINFDFIFSIQNNSTQTITYLCDSHCGGWGDRLRGITSTYILSLLLKRRFVIEMKSPCQLTNFLLPNLINWMPKNDTIVKAHQNILKLNSIVSKYQNELYSNISKINLTKLWSMYDNIYLTTNSDYITPVLKNPYFQSIISQLRIRSNESTQQILFPLIFEFLFKPNIFISQQLDYFLQQTSKQPIICLHIRLGQNPTIPQDARISYRENLVQHMIEFIDRNLSHLHTSSIFVTSDSNESFKYLQKHYGTNRILYTNGPIIHIDRYNSKLQSNQLIYQGFQKVITDFYFLAECDYNLIPRSGFSYWANRRRKNEYSNLYIYCRGLHQVSNDKWRRPHTIC